MRRGLIVSFVLGLSSMSCGGSAPATQSPAGEPATEAASPATFAEQVARGQQVYGAKCGGCHGSSGEGKPGGGPPVVGLDRGALPLAPPPTAKYRKTEFKTVADIADFVVQTMPPNAPGSLSADDYYAVLAFDLKANGIDLGDKKLDGELAKTLEVPRN
jgi:cytochrome c